MEEGISYLNRNYKDYRDALIEYSKKYYPDMALNYDDASIASWIIDLNADIADNLSYHIDKVYQETNIDSAQETGSLFNLARNAGVKIPGPKGSMAEVQFSCVLPNDGGVPRWSVAPIIKTGTKVGSSSQVFELLENVDFKNQFNNDGISDRTITKNVNSEGIVTGFTVTKLAVVTAGESKVYRQTVSSSDIVPFMEITLPDENVMNVESIIVVDGKSTSVPSYNAFYEEADCSGKTRFYEVESLAETQRWGSALGNDNRALTYLYGYSAKTKDEEMVMIPTYSITKGEWKTIRNKFITEYTDKGYLKITFGAGNGQAKDLHKDMSDFSKYQISRMINNDNLGLLPNPNSTIFVLYRVGGGSASNVAKGAITRISYLNAELRGSTDEANSVKLSLKVTNTTPSVSGKDMPSVQEMKNYIRYHRAAQNRCVTLKDYQDRILQLPPKYGTPFRVGVMEENNKVEVYLLGINNLGKLDTSLPVTMIKNIERYLENYRMINDFVEIKSGRIINLSFKVSLITDKNYNKSDVVSAVINKIKDYMDVNNHIMGENLYMGDLEKEISKTDGVINLISMDVYNKTGATNGYSDSQISQETVTEDSYSDENGSDSVADADSPQIDLEASDGILYSDGDSMFEIKYPENDIMVRVKER